MRTTIIVLSSLLAFSSLISAHAEAPAAGAPGVADANGAKAHANPPLPRHATFNMIGTWTSTFCGNQASFGPGTDFILNEAKGSEIRIDLRKTYDTAGTLWTLYDLERY